MDLPWGDEKTTQFITNVGLITSDGPNGPNIMSCEWTHQVSYSPGLIAVCIGHNKATLENIQKTKEFGIGLAASDQTLLSSVAGGSSGKEINKIDALKEMGFKFYPSKKIKSIQVKDAALNMECRLVKEIILGDHVMLIGEILDVTASGKEPLAYHKGKFWTMTKPAEKPSQEERDKIKKIVEKHRKQAIH